MTEELTVEKYGGMEFVRVCSFTESQKELFWQSPTALKIVKILRDNEILGDFLFYSDYLDWRAGCLILNT
jgi:hypothetical protein